VVEDRPGPGEAPARRGGMRHPGTDHPDALATSIAASWPTISPVLLDLDLLACWHRPSRSHHGSQAGCPRLGWDSETLTGVLLATVPDPAIGPRRQTQPRPPAANDTMAVGGQPDPFSRHHSVPQGDTSTQTKIPPAVANSLVPTKVDPDPALSAEQSRSKGPLVLPIFILRGGRRP
jgi:hypothetical protein